MRAPATVRVDNDLAAGQPGVAVGATYHEPARGVEVVDGFVVQELGGDDMLDDVLHEVGADFFVRDVVVVLGGDHDRVDTLGHHAPVFLLVGNGHLRHSYIAQASGGFEKRGTADNVYFCDAMCIFVMH